MVNFLVSAVKKPDIVRLPNKAVAGIPSAVDKWYYSLSSRDRGLVWARIQSVLKSLPAEKLAEVKARYAQFQGTSVAGGLGFLAAAAPAIGAITGSLVGAGVSLYNQQQSADLQKALSKDAMNTDILMAQLGAEAQKEISKAMTDAQREAAQIAGAAKISASKDAAAAAVAVAKLKSDAATNAAVAAAQGDIIKAQGQVGFWNKYGLVVIAGGAGLGALGLILALGRKRHRKAAA